MSKRTHLTIHNTAQFICTACNRRWTEDVNEHLNVPSMVELKVKCKCGYSWNTILERRRYYRKNVDFSGTYTYKLESNQDKECSMTVVDISRKGLKLKLNDAGHRIKEGDLLVVTFPLDNNAKTLIKRDVTVKNVFENFLGVAFSNKKHEDTDIELYMARHASNN